MPTFGLRFAPGRLNHLELLVEGLPPERGAGRVEWVMLRHQQLCSGKLALSCIDSTMPVLGSRRFNLQESCHSCSLWHSLHLSLKLKQLKSKAWGEVEAEGEAGPQAALRAEAARPHAEALSPAGPPLPAFSFSISGLKAARQRERSSMKGVGAGPSGRGGFCYTS